MNVCGGHPGSRHIFRSHSTNSLVTKNCGNSASMRVSNTDQFHHEQKLLKRETEVDCIVKRQGSPLPSIHGFQPRRRCLTIPEYESMKSEQLPKHSKSYNAQKKYSFRRLFEKKKFSLKLYHERSENENTSPPNSNKEIISKPGLLRSLSLSSLALLGKSRPKLMNRLSCPDNLIPAAEQNTPTSKPEQNSRVFWHRTKSVNPTPIGQSYPLSENVKANATSKAKDKVRHSMELTKRHSRILVTRFEIELAITKDDRNRLQNFISSKSVNLNAKDYYGKTLLHTACSVGNYQCAQMLVNAGAAVDIQDHAGFTALHCAVVANHVPCAAVMITAGADVMTSTRTRHTALTLAHEEEMILLVGRSLLLRGTQKRTTNDDKECFSLRETIL